MKFEFSQQNFEIYSNIKFRENLCSGSHVVPSGRMERQTAIMKVIVALRNFATVPKNEHHSNGISGWYLLMARSHIVRSANSRMDFRTIPFYSKIMFIGRSYSLVIAGSQSQWAIRYLFVYRISSTARKRNLTVWFLTQIIQHGDHTQRHS